MDSFLGEIRTVAFSYAPKGWVFADGRLLQIAQHQALFALLGTTFGGDGKATFQIPDLREMDSEGRPFLGFQMNKPTHIICVEGIRPARD